MGGEAPRARSTICSAPAKPRAGTASTRPSSGTGTRARRSSLAVSGDGQVRQTHRLGSDIAAGERPQLVVPVRAWQSAVTLGPWTLVGCTVAPAFDFAAFELAPAAWEPGRG